MQLSDGRDQAGVDVHVLQPRDRAGRVLGVQRAQHDVAGHRRLERDLGGLLVADLADEDHVGVGAEDRAQAGGEGEAGARVDLDLVGVRHLVLDRVLDRRDQALVAVEPLSAACERGGLAAAGRADDDHRAERLLDGALERRCGAPALMPSSSSEDGRFAASP